MIDQLKPGGISDMPVDHVRASDHLPSNVSKDETGECHEDDLIDGARFVPFVTNADIGL